MLSALLACTLITGSVDVAGTSEEEPGVLNLDWVALAELAEQPIRDRPRDRFGPMAGDWELTLSAGGISDHRFRNHNYQLNVSIGHFFTDELEIAFRQAVNFSELGGDSVIRGTSRVAADWHFFMDAARPFVGASAGWTYGDGGDTALAGPEAGVKFFVSDRAFLYGLAEYHFFFSNLRDADDRRRRGEFVFTLGIGMLW